MKEIFSEELGLLLDEIRRDGALMPPAVPSNAIELVIEQFSQKFHLPLPQDYLFLLRRNNGIQWEDTVIAHIVDPASDNPDLHTFSAHDLISLNEQYRLTGLPPHYIVLGYDDLGIYAYHTQRDTYHLLHSSEFTYLSTYEDFASLIEEAIEGPV